MPGTQKESGQDNRKQKQGLPTNTAAGDCLSLSDDLRNKQTGTTPKGDNGKVTSQPEKRDQSTETNDSKVTMQQKGKPERSLLFMTAAGVVCQTTGQGWYGWCVAMLTLLATGVQGQGMDMP